MKIRVLTAAAAIAAAATCALQPGLAHADTGNDFLAALHGYGIDVSALMGTPISPPDAIELGQAICTDLHHGSTVAGESDAVYQEMPHITDKQAANLVSAAQSTICRDTLSMT